MAQNTIPTLGGVPVKLYGGFPQVGKVAPPFSLVDKDLKDITLNSFADKRKVLNIAPIRARFCSAGGIESQLICEEPVQRTIKDCWPSRQFAWIANKFIYSRDTK